MNWNNRRLYLIRAYHERYGNMIVFRTRSAEEAVIRIKIVKGSRPDWEVWMESC